MSPARFTVMPEEKFAPLRPAVEARMREAVQQICREGFEAFLDFGSQVLLAKAFGHVGAHEGTLWLADDTIGALVPRFNTGARAAEFVGKFRQPLTSGLISYVFHSEQPLCENGVYRGAKYDQALDRQLGLLTCAMIAVPFIFGGEVRGVVSCVQLKKPEEIEADPSGFDDEHLREIQLVSDAVGRLLEGKLLRLCLGMEGQG